MMQSPLAPLKPANAANDGRDEDRPPAAPYYHMYVDEGGRSRISRCEMRGFAMKSVGGGAAPQWMNALADGAGAVTFAVLPVGWVGDWHESPKPQWVVPLSGRWFIQTQDGTRVEMGPGDVHLGEDIGCALDADGKVGHLSGTVGDEPCVQMIVGLETDPERNRPCRFE